MPKELVIAAAAIPGTIFVLANIGGSTAQMTNADSEAIKQSLAMTSLAMLIAAGATQNAAAMVTTGLTIAAVFYVMRNIWQTPGVDDLIPGGE